MLTAYDIFLGVSWFSRGQLKWHSSTKPSTHSLGDLVIVEGFKRCDVFIPSFLFGLSYYLGVSRAVCWMKTLLSSLLIIMFRSTLCFFLFRVRVSTGKGRSGVEGEGKPRAVSAERVLVDGIYPRLQETDGSKWIW